MTRFEIEQAIRTRRPFVLCASDGQRFEIRHPEYIALPPEPEEYVIVWDKQHQLFWLDLSNLTAVKFPRSKPNASHKH